MMSSGSGFSLPILPPLPVCWPYSQTRPSLVIAGWLPEVPRPASFHLPSSKRECESLLSSPAGQSCLISLAQAGSRAHPEPVTWLGHGEALTDLSPGPVIHPWIRGGANSTLSLWAKNGEKLECWLLGKGNRIRLELWPDPASGQAELGAVLPLDIPMGQNLFHSERSILLPCGLAAPWI